MTAYSKLFTLGLSVPGVIAFYLLDLPLPFLLGPMFACLLGALAGLPLAGMGQVGTAFRTILGVAAGSALGPSVVARLPDLAASLAFVPLFVAVVFCLAYPLLRRGFGFDPITSYYSAMPGGLQDQAVYGEEAGADMRTLSLIHATRVLFIVSIAPFFMQHYWQVDLTQQPGASSADVPLEQILILIASGLIGWKIAAYFKVFGSSILGPLVLTAILTLSGIITIRPPAEMIWAAQLFIGLSVGAKYTGITFNELRHFVLAGVTNAILLAAVSALFIAAISYLGIAPALDAFLAFLPGGQGEMLVIALIAGADVTYVLLHHIFRLAIVVTCAPILFRIGKFKRNENQ
ncbi:AbrB family transcriptional regulator [Rhodobacteraceae bacterium RKSG542]|uniref:AbrB family transcriptional regulator n=1 Tax=Pseudovibrio flavus TaxID=2529854 RepID=UPI0012BCCFAC|nr:AbrB family transcriptional regulator [Pseudovibrio flavus]MTI17527.1 AbrB family transcriptional regulator [Pseudovibrio flavus]